jgi:hypothetical protein
MRRVASNPSQWGICTSIIIQSYGKASVILHAVTCAQASHSHDWLPLCARLLSYQRRPPHDCRVFPLGTSRRARASDEAARTSKSSPNPRGGACSAQGRQHLAQSTLETNGCHLFDGVMTIDRCVDQGGRTKNLRDGPNCHRGLEENTSWVSLRVLHASSSIHSSDPTWTGGGHRHREIPPPSRTKWTRLVHPSVLTGHVSSLSWTRHREMRWENRLQH